MHSEHPLIKQSLISQTDVFKAIGRSRSGLGKLRKQDPTFPKPIKLGDSRQASVYYVVAEINEWLASKIQDRDAENNLASDTIPASPASPAKQVNSSGQTKETSL